LASAVVLLCSCSSAQVAVALRWTPLASISSPTKAQVGEQAHNNIAHHSFQQKWIISTEFSPAQ